MSPDDTTAMGYDSIKTGRAEKGSPTAHPGLWWLNIPEPKFKKTILGLRFRGLFLRRVVQSSAVTFLRGLRLSFRWWPRFGTYLGQPSLHQCKRRRIRLGTVENDGRPVPHLDS